MDWKIELVAVPVSGVDRAKAFYVEKVGFDLVEAGLDGQAEPAVAEPHGNGIRVRIGDAESAGDVSFLESVLAPKLAFRRANDTCVGRDEFPMTHAELPLPVPPGKIDVR